MNEIALDEPIIIIEHISYNYPKEFNMRSLTIKFLKDGSFIIRQEYSKYKDEKIVYDKEHIYDLIGEWEFKSNELNELTKKFELL